MRPFGRVLRAAANWHFTQVGELLKRTRELGARTSRQPSTMNLCTQCSSEVRLCQEALQCDICQQWTHRTYGTGMTRNFYRQLVRDGLDFNWNCPECNEGLQRSAEATDIATNESLPPDTMDTTDISIPNEAEQTDDAAQPPAQGSYMELEVSIEEICPIHPAMEVVPQDSGEVTFQVVKGGTKRGGDMLIDSRG